MSIRSMLFAAVFALASLEAAHADGLRPIEAKSIDLGEVSGVAYYAVERDGYHVVTTLAQGMAGMPIRVVSVLAWFSQHHTGQVRSKSAGTATACSSARRKQSRTKFRANWRLLT
jgi:hypothetical protein